MSETATTSMSAPPVLPRGWQEVAQARVGSIAIGRILGLTASVAYEDHGGDGPIGLPGRFVRCVLSHPDRYPTWDEMRDALWASPFGRKDRDWFMLCVPRDQHVSVHRNAFHWWQRLDDATTGPATR